MREDQYRFVTLLGQAPACLTSEQTAWAINCQSHDVAVLVAARLLKPLGKPPPNAVKYFATSDVLELSRDRTWLSKVTNALNQYWQHKNSAKRKALAVVLPAGPEAAAWLN
ncbi:MAG: hypothetical protein WCS94_20035 [Verrucomicrobiota bacterium]